MAGKLREAITIKIKPAARAGKITITKEDGRRRR